MNERELCVRRMKKEYGKPTTSSYYFVLTNIMVVFASTTHENIIFMWLNDFGFFFHWLLLWLE